jgi:hypothetical protein
MLALIRAAPDNSWLKVNTNTFASVLQPHNLIPPDCHSNSGQNAIINAWGGFAYDQNRGALLTFGGGHADYCGNDIYRFNLATLAWERAGISSQMVNYQVNATLQTAYPIDGLENAPNTAHMYDGLSFAGAADRLVYFGYSKGTNFSGTGASVYPGPVQPDTGPWLFDPAKADPNKVVGSTGSAVDPSIPGGQMWQNREYHNNHPGAYLPISFGVQSSSSDAVCKGGEDVIYTRTAGAFNVSSGLIRYEIPKPADPTLDNLVQVGADGNYIAQADLAVDTEHAVAVLLGGPSALFSFWDLNQSGASNPMQTVSVVTDLTGGFSLGNRAGMAYDPVRGRFLLWDGASSVWSLTLPSAVPMVTTGWTVQQLLSTGGPTGALLPNSGGANGKWKYAHGLDVFIGLREAPNGDVWIYKPAGWEDPAL